MPPHNINKHTPKPDERAEDKDCRTEDDEVAAEGICAEVLVGGCHGA